MAKEGVFLVLSSALRKAAFCTCKTVSPGVNMNLDNFKARLSGFCWTALILAAVAPKVSRAGDLDRVILVKGEVIEVRGEPENAMHADVKVSHVYHGPARLVGAVVEDCYQLSHSVGSFANSPFRKGQKGLWTLLEDKRGLWVEDFPNIPIEGRSREGIEPRYAQAMVVAEAIEQLDKMVPDQKVIANQKFALSETPELSAFAIRGLTDSAPAKTAEFLDGLVSNEKLTIQGQIALDELFSGSKGVAWLKSMRRLQMLNRWVSRKTEEFDADLIHRRLNVARQFGHLDAETYLSLLKMAADNSGFPLKGRKEAVSAAAGIAYRTEDGRGITPKEQEAAMALLADQVRNQAKEEVRLEAARCLRVLAEKDSRAAEIVKRLLDGVQDEKVNAVLRGK